MNNCMDQRVDHTVTGNFGNTTDQLEYLIS